MKIRLPGNRCPWCDELVDCASDLSSKARGPKPGDVSLCIFCGEWCVFAADLTLGKPDDKMYADIATNPLCHKARIAWMLIRQHRH